MATDHQYECAISMLAAQTVAKSELLGENLALKARIAELEARCAKAEAMRDALAKIVLRYTAEVPLGHQPHMLAREAEMMAIKALTEGGEHG